MEGRQKIDRVYIMDENNITVQIFPITKLKEAEQKAKEMSEYQKCKFSVKIINEYVDDEGFGISCRPSEADKILKHKNQSADLDITKEEMDNIALEIVDGSTSGSTPYADEEGHSGCISWEFCWKKEEC